MFSFLGGFLGIFGLWTRAGLSVNIAAGAGDSDGHMYSRSISGFLICDYSPS
jgi:hypothetical protein